MENIIKTTLGLALVNAFVPAVSQQQAKRPNILFCIADDASWQHFGAYGCKWVSTPGFDKVARNGILFTNAYTPNAKSAPSRACIITGRNSWQLEEAGNHTGFFPKNYQSFVEVLGKNGYFTAFTGKGWGPGNPGTVDGKERQLTGTPFQSKKIPALTTGMSGADYVGNFGDFMSQKPAGSPWCFWFGSFEPHRVYEYGSGVKKGNKDPRSIERVPSFWPDNDTVRNDMLDYAFEVEYFDSCISRMVTMLEKAGELDNTIIVITSDNGMPFPRAKGLGYEYSVHMPLAVMWKNGIKNPGRKEDGYVSFIDFAPTFLEVAGVKNTAMHPVTGKSLVDVFKATHKPADRSYILLGQERHDYGRPGNQGYPIRSVIRNGYLFMVNLKPDLWPVCNPETGYLNTDGSPTKSNILNMRRSGVDSQFWKACFGKHPAEELYYLPADRDCMNNLADVAMYQQLKQEMKDLLFAELKKQQDPRMLGNGDVFDKYPFAAETSWNFYERFMKGEIKKYQTNWVEPTDYEPAPVND